MTTRQDCEDHIKTILLQLSLQYKFKATTPKIVWDLRGKIAGTATEHQINLNPLFLQQEQHNYLKTVAHEACHTAVRQFEKHYSIPRSKPHGDRWKAFMRSTGNRPDRCHTYSLEVIDQNRKIALQATCGCRTHSWYRKPKYPVTAYKCKACNQNFKEIR